MRRTLTIYLPIIIFAIAAAGCKKNLSPVNDQQLMFQMDYINYAWGYQHSGFLMDGEGKIYTYENPVSWNFPDANFNLSEDQVAANIQFSTNSGRVSREEVAKFGSYIDNIAMGKISGLKNTGNDEGTIQFICYRASGNGSYKGTLIRMEGDFTCENLNFYSRKVVTWLREINTSIHSK